MNNAGKKQAIITFAIFAVCLTAISAAFYDDIIKAIAADPPKLMRTSGLILMIIASLTLAYAGFPMMQQSLGPNEQSRRTLKRVAWFITLLTAGALLYFPNRIAG